MGGPVGIRFGVSYFGVRDIRHARADLDDIAEAGFSSVIHTFSEHDLRYHVEDVGRLVEETRSRGLEATLDPWGVGGLFGGEAYSERALVDLSCRQVDAHGHSVPACCPNAEETRSLLSRWTTTAISLDPDRLFWDEPHYHLGAFREDHPASPCCRCEACERAWRDAGGSGNLPPEGHHDLDSFRARSLSNLLRSAIETAAEHRAKHTLCLLPHGEHQGAGSDDWSLLSQLPGIDRMATDPYWMDRPVDPAEYVRSHAERLRAECSRTGHDMEVWVQGIRIRRSEEGSIVSAVAAAAQAGADSIAFWSYRGTERMASLTCEAPDSAWDAMRRAVREFSKP
jgi:hypothetical protein